MHFANHNSHKVLKLMSKYIYDNLDSQIISELRKDGRATIAYLAETLRVSRATIQNRLDRLISSGAILGFTIRVHEALDQEKVKALMMIEISGQSTSQVIRQLRGIPELVKLHTTNGAWDLIAEINASTLSEFDEVLSKVREIDGVLSSETSLLLSSF